MRKSRVESNATLEESATDRKVLVDGEDLTPKSLGFTYEDFQEAAMKANASVKTAEVLDEKESKDEEEMKKQSLRPKTAKKKGTSRKSSAVDEASVEIYLQETPTITLFLQNSVCVHKESTIHAEIEKRNQAYDAILKRKRTSPGIFMTNDAQTYNRPLKDKSTTTAQKSTRESGCTATSWDIHDSMSDKKNEKIDILEGLGMGEQENKDTDSAEVNQVDAEAVEKLTRVLYATPGCLLSVAENEKQNAIVYEEGESVLKRERHKKILESSSLLDSLNRVERLIQQNVYHDCHLDYRGMPAIESMSEALRRNMMLPPSLPVPSSSTTKEEEKQKKNTEESKEEEEDKNDALENKTSKEMTNSSEAENITDKMVSETKVEAQEEEASVSKLKLFWKFECEKTSSREVTCESWNPRNKDLLAVGYGAPRMTVTDESKKQFHGLVCFWTLKNPEFPARILNFDEEVTTIAFSRKRPYLLAVGVANGSVFVYDIRSEKEHALLECSTGSPFKHSQAVWQIQWIDKGMEKGGEVLVTISSDGKVKEFNFKQGLQSTNLMTLKRIPRSQEENFRWKPLNSKGEGIVSGEESGMCFDFALGNPHIYFCGTSDGYVHSCSCSYNEQYLNTLEGHQASVLRLRCHPTCAGVFLTCSADWTVQLWDVNTDVKSSISSSSLENESVMTFRQTNLKDSVNDVAWSPFSATTFASIASDGRIEIWDLSESTADPIITHYNDKVEVVQSDVDQKEERCEGDEEKESESGDLDKDDLFDTFRPKEVVSEEKKITYESLKLTCLAFSENSSAIAVGDHLGSVSVYEVPVSCSSNSRRESSDSIDELRALIEAAKRTKLQKKG